MKLPAPRLLPMTILVTAVVLGIKAQSLTHAAMANDSSVANASHALGPKGGASPQGPASPARAASPPSPTETRLQAEPSGPANCAGRSEAAAIAPDWSLLQDLRARRDGLDRRARELDLREAAVQAEKQSLNAELAELSRDKQELKQLELARQDRTEASWVGTVKLYEAMKPSEAAAIFDTLDQRLLVQLLDRMNERKAAAIMGNMDPERARTATQALAAYRLRRDADPLSASGSAGPVKVTGPG